jgi:hypothetical protein
MTTGLWIRGPGNGIPRDASVAGTTAYELIRIRL